MILTGDAIVASDGNTVFGLAIPDPGVVCLGTYPRTRALMSPRTPRRAFLAAREAAVLGGATRVIFKDIEIRD